MSADIGQYDVIIVGGGPGGAYAAWRAKTGPLAGGATSPLPSDPEQRRVLLIESSDRIGGRLESIVAPGTDGLVAEFGGMGFTSNDRIFTYLVDDQFELDAVSFPMPNQYDLAYVRGVRLTMADAVDPTKIPYRLAADEQQVITDKGPGALVVWAAEKLIPGCSKFTTRKQWTAAIHATRFDGRELHEVGFWNFLLMSMTNEAFTYIHDMFGHFFEVANWNCAQALPWFLLDGNATYRTLAAGYDQLPKTLAAAFSAAGGTVVMNTRVSGVTAAPSGPGLVVGTADGPFALGASTILAMPRRALQLIAPSSVVLPEEPVQRLITSVTGQRVMKIFLTFAEPWWSALNITTGASATDLPLGQCWYFDPPAPGQGDALLMASYNDTLATSYWAGLEDGPRFPTTTPDPPAQWSQQLASQAMVSEVVRQLELVHGIDVPAPKAAAYMNWARDPFGGAFHTWNVGVHAASVEQAIMHPDPSVPLFICGDAYSFDQGWTEGAFDTAERVLQRSFGLAPFPPSPGD